MITNDGKGTIITFYSYKGGTGRTMALANVATLLAMRDNRKVLMIDWDLEAPGLHTYFKEYLSTGADDTPGLIDLFVKLDELPAGQVNEFAGNFLTDYLTRIEGLEGGELFLMKAGRFGKDYTDKVQTFNWRKFFDEKYEFFPHWISHLEQNFDFILIDSRTGLTDISGICTMILPERIVTVFTPNSQSLDNLLHVMGSWVEYRLNSPDFRPYMIYPLPSRVELNELDLYKEWQGMYIDGFEKEFRTLYKLPSCKLKAYFDLVALTYIPKYAYGEKISVLEDGLQEADNPKLNVKQYAELVSAITSNENLWDYSWYVSKNYKEAVERIRRVAEEKGRSLNLSALALQDIPEEILQLDSLEVLDLSNNELTDIDRVKQLPLLEELNLSVNLIEDIGPVNGLTFLQQLDLSRNHIRDIAPLKDLILRGGSINIANNPVDNLPVEIAAQGNNALINYFTQQEEQGMSYLQERNIIIVGYAAAGKTTLSRLLTGKKELPSTMATRGVDIERTSLFWEEGEKEAARFNCNIWDFGGQEIVHATHQLFFKENSLYILVLDPRSESAREGNETIEYWLQSISPYCFNSSLLILFNDKYGGFSKNIDLVRLKSRYPFLKNSYMINLSATTAGAPEYRKDAETAFTLFKRDLVGELTHLPVISLPIPRRWAEIRYKIQRLGQKRPYINQTDYQELCMRHGLNDMASQQSLSQYFHDLGVFLHFRGNSLLDDFIVLQNTWVTSAIYAILNNRFLTNRAEAITATDLSATWKDQGFDQGVHKYLIAIMKEFELCYELAGEDTSVYIFPEMLKDFPPEDYKWQPDKDLEILYSYRFLPKGLLTRLMVRLNRNIRMIDGRQLIWRTGLLIDGQTLSSPDTYCEVTEEKDNSQIAVRTHGDFSQRLLRQVVAEIDSLNDQIPHLQYSKMIPCNCPECTSRVSPHFYDHDLLQRARQKDRSVQCPVSLEDMSPDELLHRVGGIGSPKKSIFISCSYHDEPYKKELEKRLKGIDNVVIWDDADLRPGQDWMEAVEREINRCDIIVLLISPNYLHSQTRGKYRNKPFDSEVNPENAGKMVPVFVSPCDISPYKKLPWSAAQINNANQIEWISSSENKDIIYDKIVMEILRRSK